MADFTMARRVKGARELAGLTSAEQLAAAIDARGLGARKLYEIEQGRNYADRHELAAIAEACGLPLEWFTADFGRLAEISEPPAEIIAREIATVTERVGRRRKGLTATRHAHRRAGP